MKPPHVLDDVRRLRGRAGDPGGPIRFYWVAITPADDGGNRNRFRQSLRDAAGDYPLVFGAVQLMNAGPGHVGSAGGLRCPAGRIPAGAPRGPTRRAPLSQPLDYGHAQARMAEDVDQSVSTRAAQVGPEAEHDNRLRRRTGDAKRLERRQYRSTPPIRVREVRHSMIAGCSEP